MCGRASFLLAFFPEDVALSASLLFASVADISSVVTTIPLIVNIDSIFPFADKVGSSSLVLCCQQTPVTGVTAGFVIPVLQYYSTTSIGLHFLR